MTSERKDLSSMDQGAGAPKRPGRDLLGVALIVVASFLGVAVAMAYLDPKAQASGMTGAVMMLVDFLGASAFFLAAGLAWIGLRLFIQGVDGKLGRDLFGVLLTTLTLPMLIGALSPDLGGTVGSVGAMVTQRLTVFVGVVFGLIAVLLPAWFLWLRPAALAAGELPRSSASSLAPSAPRATDSSSVTLAEAEGLLPKARPQPKVSTAAELAPSSPAKGAEPAGGNLERTARRDLPGDGPRLSPPKVVAPSPYPPDVRREGRVPEGARPLGAGPNPVPVPQVESTPPPRAVPPHAAAASAPASQHESVPAEDPRHASALRTGALGAAAAGARAADLRPGVQQPVADEERRQRGAGDEPAGVRGSAAGAQPARAELSSGLEREAVEEPETYADAVARASEPSLAQPLERTPPRPSWEQPELFEEPVDAYGTPLSLVEKLREAPGAAAADEAPLPWGPDEDLGDEVIEGSLRPLAATPPAAAPAAPESAARAAEVAPASSESAAAHEHAVASSHTDAASTLDAPAPLAAEGQPERESLREAIRGFVDLRERGEPNEAEAARAAANARAAEEARVAAEALAAAQARAAEEQRAAAEARAREEARAAEELRAAEQARAAEEARVAAEALAAAQARAAEEQRVAAEARAREEARAAEELRAAEQARAAEEARVAAEALAAAQARAAEEQRVAAEARAREEARAAEELRAAEQARAAEEARVAAAKPAVVIHSLFGEEAPEVAPQSARAESADSAANSDAPSAEASGSDDVVLEPARKPKRKKAKGEAVREQASEASNVPQHAEAPSAAAEESAPQAQVVAEAAEPVAERNAEVVFAPETVEVAAREVDAESFSEPQVELTPARPRSRSRVTVDEIVFKAGCLFVERQRVAVSMLQREFGLDFDAATSVLDQLQRVGLIGPYLGGQRRDILLNMDEWQELVGVE
jgi:hypothetical protein